ncbi:hypothetical protein LguiB_008526 [Lonicera macranthoides]
MAVRSSPSPTLIIHKPSPTNKKNNKPFHRVMMLSHTHISSAQTSKTPLLQIKSSSFKNKVFEDQAKGIVCYRDNSGEIICEGYDEGPRLQPELSRINCSSNQRDVEIVDLLQRSFRQILEGVELNCADEHATGATDFHSNGFNTFC